MTTCPVSGLCCLFPIFFGPLAFSLERFIQFCALGHPKHSRQESHATLRSRITSSWAETFAETPGIAAWADMQGLGNAFHVIILKARDCEARLQLCYICLLPGKCWQWDLSIVCFMWCGFQCLKGTRYLVPLSRGQCDWSVPWVSDAFS